MDYINQDGLLFFNKHPAALPLYEAFAAKLFELFPDVTLRGQKTQITFSNRRVFACVSLMRVKRKAELPAPYIVVTLGLAYPLGSRRVAAKTEPYPGRWTTHFVIGSTGDLDQGFFAWVREAYDFSESK